MNDLPVKALSIRQPWVWAILNAGKRVENRPATVVGVIVEIVKEGIGDVE